MSGKIGVLRALRDRCLVKTTAGRAFVESYGRYSPPAADLIAAHGWLRSLARLLLLPIVGLAWLCV